MAHSVEKLVFIGFNSRVAALDSKTGSIVWQWKADKRSGGYVTLLLLGPRQLIAAVDGYIYCLDPATGDVLWFNQTSGFGTGVTSMVALQKQNPNDAVVAGAAAIAAAAATAAAT